MAAAAYTSCPSTASISVRRSNHTNTITVSGRVALKRSKASAVITISKPAGYAAHVFTGMLRSLGVRVDGAATIGSTPTTRVRLASDTSVPLSTIVKLLSVTLAGLTVNAPVSDELLTVVHDPSPVAPR